MTADKIYGDSIAPQKYLNNLAKWRNSLLDRASAKLSTIADYAVITTAGADYGKLKLTMRSANYQIVQITPTPIMVSQYLEIKFRIRQTLGGAVKARVIAQPYDSSGDPVSGVATNGPTFDLELNNPIEVSAIIGSGKRDGVDLAWGLNFKTCAIGLEIMGVTGSELMIDPVEVIDATGHFLATNSDWVDIRDYGAIGDGVFDNQPALLAADAVARGRAIFIPRGVYFVGSDITILSPVRAYGSLTAADTTAVMLADTYNYDSYLHVFKNEYIAFRKAVQALYRFQNHTKLDLNGRSIPISEPIDMFKLASRGASAFFQPRMIQNGQLDVQPSAAWDSKIVSATASFDTNNPTVLTNVSNIEQIELGSIVQGTGVGREIFVSKIDVSGKIIYLSSKINNAAASQTYKFKRFRFILDYSGFERMSRQEFAHLDFQCNFAASVIMFAQTGFANKFVHNWVREPKDRALCSFAEGCYGLTVESCFFVSSEGEVSAKDRTTVAISTRQNDVKIRNNTAAYFRHFAYLNGCGHLITSNHFFQGNKARTTDRTAGVVITYPNAKTTINGNYVDNSWIEITGENSKYAENDNYGQVFGNLVIVGNVFTANTVDNWFHWIMLVPYGDRSRIDGLSVTNNAFYVTGSNEIQHVEGVDESNGKLDMSKTRNLRFQDNAFYNVIRETQSPITREIEQGTAAKTWTASFADVFPFNAQVLSCDGVVPLNGISRQEMPLVSLAQGSSGEKVSLNFSAATSGAVLVRVSADLPN